MAYDSRPDTLKHIEEVRYRMLEVIHELSDRLARHDSSKLESPELEVFNEYTPKLNASTYGSDEYKEFLVGMGEGLTHHYQHNDHHPEHFPGGISEMNLLQLLEMLADWKAATSRHADGSLRGSIYQNATRFGYDDEMTTRLLLTAEYLDWLD
jgi:Family of unknown function (DUF5662)